MGKKIICLLTVVCICVSCISCSGEKEEKRMDGGKINLEGQWKVTDYLAGWDTKAEYDYYEHFLGRSIIIKPNRIIKSFGCWDDLLEDVVSQYRTVETETVGGGNYGSRLGEEWQRKYGNQEVVTVTFDMPGSAEWNARSTFVLTEEGEVLCWYLGNIYYMERYREAVTDLAEGDLYGEWEVKRLVSYQDGWRGRNGLVYGTEYKEEDGGNFYPESYLGNTVWIGNTGVELHDGDGRMTGSIRTDGYSSRMVDKYDYQNGKGIHDELGLTNEEIQVFAGNIPAPDGAVLDGEIVAVSRTEIIMKIYQGWYLLKKLPV